MSEIISHYFSYQDRNADLGLESSLDVLALYDDNDDGKIDEDDGIYDGLSIWQDANGDGITDDGEIRTLKDQGIESIDLGYDTVDETVEGNLISKKGGVEFEDGTSQEWNEVSFNIAGNGSDLFKEVLQPLLDEDDMAPVSFDNVANNASDEDHSEVSDPVSLLKEIVGPTMDVQLPDTDPTPLSTTTINGSQSETANSSVSLSEEQESYSSVVDIDEDPVILAAQ
jgi:hypothetical protein